MKTTLKFTVLTGALAFALLFPVLALAQEEAATEAGQQVEAAHDAGGDTHGVKTAAEAAAPSSGLIGFGKALMMGMAVAAATIAQSLATGRAVESVSRNPSVAANIQTMMIIGLVLIESLVLFALGSLILNLIK
jgi:F-type H+-transporting ATPase subunit c